MKHPLDPLLRPRSIAVLGASARELSMGWWALTNLERGGFDGPIYPVNPGYDELLGHRCHATLSDLPETPDLVVFAIADRHVEKALAEAIELGIPAAVLMSSLCLDDDPEPRLKERVRQMLQESGMLVCGANGMGFYNFRDGVWGTGFDSRQRGSGGNVALISHSGAGMSGIVDCEERIQFNLAISTGNELSVTMDQYLDFALELPETRAVGLFIETTRNPEGFRAALAKARDRHIPIVAIKVGRTKKSAELAISHSGAMAGDDAAYAALFDRYGVHRVDDMDEMATALILFAAFNPLGDGGLVALHDSGGEQQLMVDLADRFGVPLTELSSKTAEKLRQVLEPELPAVNPLDGWSRGGPDAEANMAECMSLMLQDPGAAIGAVMHDRAPDGLVYDGYMRYLEKSREASGKPVVLCAARQGTGSDPKVVPMTHDGLPVLDGVVPFLRGVRGLMNYRDFLKRGSVKPPAVPKKAVDRWRVRLNEAGVLDEEESLALLRDFGIEASAAKIVDSEAELEACAAELGYPLVLKTAMPGINHKSDCGGVYLDLGDRDALAAAYADLAGRLGPRALLAPMAPPGVEMLLGARNDPQFGPVVLLGFGGVLAEVLGETVFALPPFPADEVRRRLNELRLRPLLDGVRGRPPVNVDAFCNMAARFSAMVHSLRDELDEVDLNPVIAGPERCIAVDALVVARR